MEAKRNVGSYIREQVIKNLLNTHKRIADAGTSKEVIMMSKFLFKIAKQFDDVLFYFRVEESDQSAKQPPEESKN